MKTFIIVRLQVEGIHRWPGAVELNEVSYLKDFHRHIFYIECKREVTHDDRDVEFIMFKHQILGYLNKKYFYHTQQCLKFNEMSCEMIAKELLFKFDLESCKVYEDNENGAEVTK